MELGFGIAIATVAVMVIERAKVAVRVTAIEIANGISNSTGHGANISNSKGKRIPMAIVTKENQDGTTLRYFLPPKQILKAQ